MSKNFSIGLLDDEQLIAFSNFGINRKNAAKLTGTRIKSNKKNTKKEHFLDSPIDFEKKKLERNDIDKKNRPDRNNFKYDIF